MQFSYSEKVFNNGLGLAQGERIKLVGCVDEAGRVGFKGAVALTI